MFYAIILGIVLIIAILEFVMSDQRIQKATFFISSVLVFIVMAFNRMNADYSGYLESFTSNDPHNEIGYNTLVKLLNSVHLPFESILMIMGISIFLVFYFYSEKSNASFAALLYLIYPLALDLPQIRNDLMYMIVLLTIYLLRNKNIIGLIGGILLSSTFHYFGLVYLPFSVLVKRSRRQFFRILGAIFFVFLVGSLVLRLFQSQMPEVIASEIRPFEWFYFAIQVFHVTLDIITVWWIDRKLGGDLDAHSNQGSIMELMYRFSWYSIIVIPLAAYSSEMYRFRRNAQVIKYIYCANAMKKLGTQDRVIVVSLIALNLAAVVGMLFMTGDMAIFDDLNNNVFNIFRAG